MTARSAIDAGHGVVIAESVKPAPKVSMRALRTNGLLTAGVQSGYFGVGEGSVVEMDLVDRAIEEVDRIAAVLAAADDRVAAGRLAQADGPGRRELAVDVELQGARGRV